MFEGREQAVMTIAQMLTASVFREPTAIAIVDGDRRLTYLEWYNNIQSLAFGLKLLGLKEGNHLVAVLSNTMEMASLYWACQILGVIFTPFNWRASSVEMAYVIEDADADVVAYEHRSQENLISALTDISFPDDRLIRISVDGPGTEFSQLLTEGVFTGQVLTGDSEVCLMLYTSGTTGRPKGVPRSHAAEKIAALGCIAQLHYRYGEISLGVMPLFHTMGIRTLLMSTILNGTFICMPTYDTRLAASLINKENVSVLFLVPTMFHDIANQHESSHFDLSSVKNIAYAGMSMTTSLVERCTKMFPRAQFSNFYGSSEIYTFAIRNNLSENPSSAGRPGFGQILRVVRADSERRVGPGELMPVGSTGEIIASMDSIDSFNGYWKRPDADAKSIRDGWYFTGDLGRFDENGEIYVLGRVDDMIISGGENIYAEEVENVLAKSPNVSGVAVIGMPDERWGERVVAFIEPESVDLTPDALDLYCLKSDLARFKRPRGYAFVRNIPRSASGKLLRRYLRTGKFELLSEYKNTI